MYQILSTADSLVDTQVKESILAELRDYVKSGKLTWTLVIIAASIVIWFLFKRLLKARLKVAGKRTAAERNVRIMANVIKIIIGFLAVILILQVNGINITTLVAGLSLTSVVVGFALQTLLADWISGITIVSEHFYSIGDIIKVDGQIGRVINVNLKVTIIEDMDTGNIVSINNRLVSKAEVLSDRLDVDIPISYEMSVEDVKSFIDDICNDIRKMDGIKQCEAKGIQNFDESIIYHRIRINVKDVIKRWQIRRDVQSLVREKYQAWGISIPYNRMDVCIVEGEKKDEKES